jgi:acyl CoA:acetate/3-ketoacid CoA transferase alpha subunit
MSKVYSDGPVALAGLLEDGMTIMAGGFGLEELDPDGIHTAGIYVKRLIHAPNVPKRIEQRTLRKRAAEPASAAAGGGAI